MKKIINSKVFFFVLGAIIFGSIGVLASGLLAGNISYDNTTSGLKDSNNQDVTTVQGAIDTLYEKANKPLLNKLDLIIKSSSDNSTRATALFSLNNVGGVYKNYKYFKITSLTKNNNSVNCALSLYSSVKSKWISGIQANTEYEVSSDTDGNKYNQLMIATSGYNAYSECVAAITFYNK